MKKSLNKTRSVLLIVSTILIAVILTGCVSINFAPGTGGGVMGRGELESFTWNVGNITEVRVEMHANVEFYSAQSDTVTLEIQPNLRDYIVVEERGGVLTVRTTRNINTATGRTPVLTVSTPTLNSFTLAGAGTFTTHDTIDVASLSLRLDGAGSGNLDLNVDDLSVNMAGAGRFSLSGRADSAAFSLAGAGTIEALSLQTRDANVNLAGVGTVRVSCSESLRITAGGVGTVEYRGSPTVDIARGGLVTVRNVS